MEKPLFGRQQSIDPTDVEAVLEALQSELITQGPRVASFEEAVASYCGAPHAVAMCNATAALHVAAMALDVGPGDVVWTSPNTFVASANCARYCGADVDFVDVDPQTYNMSIPALEAKLAQAEAAGRLPKVVIPVHFSGQPVDMAAIGELRRRYGFRVIEDASHALGAEYAGVRVGRGDHSDITILSFHPVKMITTGEGGMALTRDAKLKLRMARLRSHGITRDPAQMQGGTEGPWYYQQIELGYNFRITDVQCALGLSQLRRLDSFVSRRRELAARYDRMLEALPVITPWQDPQARSSFHLYVAQLRDSGRRAEVFERLKDAGVNPNVHYIPVHTQPYYERLGFKAGMFPAAESYYRAAISLPIFPGMKDSDQDYVVQKLQEALA